MSLWEIGDDEPQQPKVTAPKKPAKKHVNTNPPHFELPVEVDETAVTSEDIAEATPLTTVPAGEDKSPEFKIELMPGVVTVDEAELTELINQNLAMKTEIGQLVGLFKNFEGLISGKGGMGSLVFTIPKLMGNPQVNAQIAAIQPIIEKYTKTQ